MNQQIDFQQEFYRKIIHLFSLVIPIGYGLTDKITTLIVLLPVTFIIVGADLFKHRVKEIRELANKIFGKMLRSHESTHLSGASYTLLASSIVIILLPKNIAITALAVPFVGDPMAGLIGRKFGRMRFFTKTVEGTLAFILSGSVVVYIIMLIFQLDLLFFVTGFVAVCIAGVVEAASAFLRIDDNFAAPLVMGLYMGVLL